MTDTTPTPTVFISYSHKDETWKDKLLPHLRALETAGIGMQVWHDRKIDGGDKWYPEIQDAMGNAAAAVLLVSADFLASPFCVQEEVPALLKRQEQQGMLLVPVLLRACMWKAHRWLSARQMIPRDGKCITIDYAGDQADVIFAAIAEQVFNYFDSKTGTAEVAAPRAPAAANAADPFTLDFSVEVPGELDTGFDFVESWDIDSSDDQADSTGAGIPRPRSKPLDFAAPAAPSFSRSPASFPAADADDPFTEWVGHGAAPTLAERWPSLPAERVDLTHLPNTGAALFGRDAELAQLDEAWTPTESTDHAPLRVLAFVAHGGVGKSTLVNHWLGEMASEHYRGASHVFGWSFYSQGVRQQTVASADAFIHAALSFFGDADPSAGSPWDKGSRLAHLVGGQRALLVLDGLEPLQSPYVFERGKLRDPAMDSLLRGLARQSAGLCLITTRERLPDVGDKPGVLMLNLEQITAQAGRALLRTTGVVGTDAELLDLANRFGPHALAVSLLGVYLRAQPGQGIAPAALLELVPSKDPVDCVLAGFDRWLGEGPERDALRLLGLFDRPADAGCLAALRRAPLITGLTEHLASLDDAAWEQVLTRLEMLQLVQVQRDFFGRATVDAHPLVRAHFGAMDKSPAAWGDAHGRLFEHLCGATTEGERPSLEDLQPLYQAVRHGCLAGLARRACDEVYRARILRPNQYYSTDQLGAFGSDLGAVACFFETPWRRVTAGLDAPAQAWLLNQAAFRLRALGRLTEAVEPMRAALEMLVVQEDWKGAATGAGNLSELTLTLGKLDGASGARHHAEQAVRCAERSGDISTRMIMLTTHADALHQAGHVLEATELCRQAEALQAQRQPQHPLLYSLWGFRFCDLLLSPSERAAWRACLRRRGQDWDAEALVDVERRAGQALQIVLHGSRIALNVALDHLTMGRAALYKAVLQGATLGPASPALAAAAGIADNIGQAVDGLRHASRSDYMPRALLTRAWLRALQGHLTGPDSAQDDLDEAWDIAEHGGMALFIADIHLHRARLFLRESDYPWNQHLDGGPRGPRDDLAEARRLIEKHGYWRRKAELEDAEAALAGSLFAGGVAAPAPM